MKLARGALKIIAHSIEAARSNESRARAGSRRLKPVWIVFVQDDDEKSFSRYDAFNFRASSLNPRHEPLGARHAYPLSNSNMRRALSDGVWFETRSEINLVTEQEVPEVEEPEAAKPVPRLDVETAMKLADVLTPTTTEETPVDGK